MLKMFGAVLVVLSGALIGLFQANRLSDRPKQLRELLRALQRLETEIGYGLTPLPDALRKMAVSVQPPTKLMWDEMANRMEAQSGDSAAQIWHEEVENIWRRTSMKPIEKAVILQLGHTIGVSDRDDQLKHIQLAKHQLSMEEEAAQEERDRYSKMWKTLGVLGGAFIVILML